MLRTTITTGVLIGGVTLLLAGCGASTHSAGSESTQPTSPSPAANAQQEAPPSSQATSGAECTVEDLELGLNNGDGATGTMHHALVFTNKGNRTCTIQGFPGVSYVTGDDGVQVGPAAARSGEKGPAVTLKPGESAHADMAFEDVHKFEPEVCEPTEVRGLRVYPPHEHDSMFLPKAGLGCAGTPQYDQLIVRTVEAGPGPA